MEISSRISVDSVAAAPTHQWTKPTNCPLPLQVLPIPWSGFFIVTDNNSENHGLGECCQCGNVASPQLVIEIGYWQYRLFATFAPVAAESLCLSATLR